MNPWTPIGWICLVALAILAGAVLVQVTCGLLLLIMRARQLYEAERTPPAVGQIWLYPNSAHRVLVRGVVESGSIRIELDGLYGRGWQTETPESWRKFVRNRGLILSKERWDT